MAYVGILIITILISFIVVRIGGLALQLTGMEPEVARFQALSAFSGTGFTTTEAERVVRHKTRRRIVTILIILGNAGLVAIIATLVASFTNVTGYGWFFARLGIIIISIFILYRLIVASRIGNKALNWVSRPLIKRILAEAPAMEEIFHAGRDWGISLLMIREKSKVIDMTLADVKAQDNIVVLAIDREDAFIHEPDLQEQIKIGDRLVVYGSINSVKGLLS